jgi:hypothetical protein
MELLGLVAIVVIVFLLGGIIWWVTGEDNE